VNIRDQLEILAREVVAQKKGPLLMVLLQLSDGSFVRSLLTMQQDFYTKSVFCNNTMPVHINIICSIHSYRSYNFKTQKIWIRPKNIIV